MKLKLVIFAFLVLSFTSCRTSRLPNPVAQVTSGRVETDSVSEVSVESYTQADSGKITVELGSDANGNVIVKNILDYSPGKNVKPEIRIKDNFIYLTCRVDSAEVYKRYSRFFTSSADTTSRVEIIPAPGGRAWGGKNGFFHRALHTAGFLFLAEILIAAGYFIFKLKKLFSII